MKATTNIYVRRVPKDLWRRMRLLAVERTTPVGQLVTQALSEYLKREEQDADSA